MHWRGHVGAALLAVASPGVALSATGEPMLAAFGAAVAGLAAALSLTSHLLADSVTPMGVKPFVPLSSWHHSFDVTPARDPRANRALLVVGVVATLTAQALVATLTA